MNTLYLIRHSVKDKKFNNFNLNDSAQIKNEKLPLSKEGKMLAKKLAEMSMLQNLDQVWSSNYQRAIETAQYICQKNKLPLNISNCFDERHYGNIDINADKETFWINQFKNKDLKYPGGESQNDVCNRFAAKIEEIIKHKDNQKIAIIAHNACILFYLLKYCKLEKAKAPKKLTIKYQNACIIDNAIMASPSIIEVKFAKDKLMSIKYFDCKDLKVN